MSDDEYKSRINDEINKLGRYNSKYADKPTQRLYYYPRPTPQDVLHEEQEFILNNSYSGKNIYEWNIDGYTERQIYNLSHRMMMYSTIAKNNGNTDKTVANMIVAGFTGQLKGRWSDNSKNIRTLLNGLKCPTLTSFRWYKDTFLSRVMELPDSKISHWKSKFIDGLPSLFAEKIRKKLKEEEVVTLTGGKGPNNILVQHARNRLIASNIAESSASSSISKPNDPLYGEFMEFLKNKKRNNPSYANALNEEENEDLQEYHQSSYKEKIIFLEYQDVMRYFDSGNDLWILMSRYLDNAPYAAHAYK
nr:hypothetical protein [Tanacetum cinerariifolium]